MAEEQNEAQAAEGPKVSPVVAQVLARFDGTGTVIHTHDYKGDDTVVVRAADILEVMTFLKEDPELAFDLLLDVTAVDYLGNEKLQPYLAGLKARFEVVYHLTSLGKGHRIRIKAPVTEEEAAINSVTPVWIGADWLEREVWDLYGIRFRGHHNLKRVLLYEAFEGHPLRKDYGKMKRQPLIGPIN